MLKRRIGLQGLVIAAVATSFLFACQTAGRRVPKGDWHIETGRARVVDDTGSRRTRIEAIEDAQRDAWLKILRHVEAMPAFDDNLVGDHMVQNPVTGARVRALILSSRRFATRYRDNDTVEVDMGVNLDEVQRTVREGSRP